MGAHCFHRCLCRIGLGVVIFSSGIYAQDQLALRVPENSLNQSVAALTDAHGFGIAQFNETQYGWVGVSQWWFQVNPASADLKAAGRVDVDITANAQGKIDFFQVLTWRTGGHGKAILHGNLSLINDMSGRRLTYGIRKASDVEVREDDFPDFVNTFFSGAAQSVFNLYTTLYGPYPLSVGASFLPTIPQNAIVETEPTLTTTENDLLLTLTPKRVLPDLALTGLSFAKTGAGKVYRFDATITNVGDAEAKRDIKVALFDGDPDRNGDHVIDSPLPQGVSELAPAQIISVLGEGATTTVTWQAALTNGVNHQIYAVADSSNLLLEKPQGSEGNGRENNIMSAIVPGVVGDLDGNGCVDRVDVNIVIDAVLHNSADLSFDFNGDRVVNIGDARKVATYCTKANCVPCN